MLNIAIAQLTSTADAPRNLAICRELAKRAVSHGAEAVFYPECADIVFDQSYDKEGERRDPKNIKAFVEGMRETAKELSIYVSLGVHSEDPKDAKKWLNSAITFSPSGELVHRYDKIHPCVVHFDGMDVDERGSVNSGASDQSSTHGLEPVEMRARSGETWKIGMSICYDIRYPQLAAHHRRQGADAIAYLTAWFPFTRTHWEPLIASRAIDNQAYVIAPGQYGQHSEERSSLGGSAVLDPWGNKVVSLPQISHDVPAKGDDDLVDGHGDYQDTQTRKDGDADELEIEGSKCWLGYATLRKEIVDEIRTKLPLYEFTRLDVYGTAPTSEKS